MSDEKNGFSFINEKIKDKPFNRKKFLRQLLLVVFFAIVFGVVSCVTFLFVKSAILQQITVDGSPEEVGLSDDTEGQLSETEGDAFLSDSAQNLEDEGTDPVQQTEPIVITEEKELEISDYQNVQNQLYEIGKSADYYIVTVTGVGSDTDWFDTPYEKKGQGSGVIFGNNGSELLVVVQEKIIAQAEQISVTFCDGMVAGASLKEYDANTGLAVLSIPVSGVAQETLGVIQTAQIGNAAGISRGDIVIAVGSPLGTNYSVLTGSVTSVNNEITTPDCNFSVFTTDIVGSIEGSGVLLNSKGKIIGFIMQEYAVDGSENTLTAVPVSQIREILEPLSNGQTIPYLGLRLSTVTERLALEHEIPMGAYIIAVEMDSPAMQAGLQSGDVLISMNGTKITTAYDYEKMLRESSQDEIISFVVERMGAEGIYTELEYSVMVGVLR